MPDPQLCDHLLATGPAFPCLQLYRSDAATEEQRSALRDVLAFERGIQWHSYCPDCGAPLKALIAEITEYPE